MGKRRGVRSLLDNLKMEAIREGVDEDASVMSGMMSPQRSPRRSVLGSLGGDSPSASESENDSPGANVKQATSSTSNNVPAPPLEATNEKVATIDEGEEEDPSDSTQTTDDESSEEKNNDPTAATATGEGQKTDESMVEETNMDDSALDEYDQEKAEEYAAEEDDAARPDPPPDPPAQGYESPKKAPQSSKPAQSPEEKKPMPQSPMKKKPPPESGPKADEKTEPPRRKNSSEHSKDERRGGPRRKEHSRGSRRRHPRREKSDEKLDAEAETSSGEEKKEQAPPARKPPPPEQAPARKSPPPEQAPARKPGSPEEKKEQAPARQQPPSVVQVEEPKPEASEAKKEPAPARKSDSPPTEIKAESPKKKEPSDEKTESPAKSEEAPTEPKQEPDNERSRSNHSSTFNDSELDVNEALGDSESRISVQDDDFSQMSSVSAAEDNFDDDGSHGSLLGDMDGEADEEDDEQLTWRLDPDLSLSDWTVMIRNKDDQSVATYYLHKNILAVGPRKSEYFFTAFRKSRQEPTNPPNTTKLVFEGVAAKAFPQVWDYIYSQDGKVEFTTENVMGLRHLAKFFGIKSLYKLATEFLPKDISMANIFTYYKNSTALKDDRTLATAAKHCARNILRIDVGHELLPAIDGAFLKRILSEVGDAKAKRYHCSLLVAQFFKLHKESLDTAGFLSLVDEKLLPLIHHSVALDMLELEADVVIVTVSILKFTEVSSLQKRCIKDLAIHWKELSEVEREHISRVCRKLSSGVVTDLLIKTLAQVKRKAIKTEANSDSGSVTSEVPPVAKALADGKAKPAPSRTEHDAKIAEQERAHKEEIVLLKKQYETNLMRLRDLCVEKDKHIANYWQELQRYKRLPNSLEGKLVSSGMMNKASMTPEIGNEPSDGQLYVEKKGGKQKYPMYYYKAD